MMDRIACLASTALGQGRIVAKLLENQVRPEFPPERRRFVEHVSRRIACGQFFDEPFLRDLEALISRIEEMVTEGTSEIWLADEYNVSGGHVVTQLDVRAMALGSVVDELQALWTAIAETLDAAKAIVVASELASE